jgi:phosphoglycerate dehydrogenase-like enzyme
MTKQALVLAEFDPAAIPTLEALGYTVELAGWGQTRHALTEGALVARIPEVALLIVEVERVTEPVIEAAQQLEIIAACRAQPVNVDVAAATARRIAVLSTPARNADSVADFALGLLLAVGRHICRADRHVREHGWYVNDEIPYFHFRGPELAGKTLGLVGCGGTGQELAQRARALGMNVLACDPYLAQDDLPGVARLARLDEMLAQADFISMHVPVTNETERMIGAAELARMKPTAYLINTARAAVVDETALYDALKKRRIAGAALDVFWQEPLPADSPWLELDNVLLTPHLAGAADEVKNHHSAMVVEDVRTLLKGGCPARLVNPEVLQAERVRKVS